MKYERVGCHPPFTSSFDIRLRARGRAMKLIGFTPAWRGGWTWKCCWQSGPSAAGGEKARGVSMIKIASDRP